MKTHVYRITVRGIIDPGWTAYFSGAVLNTGPGGVTYILADVEDQSALHGLLNRVRDLNLYLVSILLIDRDGITPVECLDCPFRKTMRFRNNPADTSLDR
ncbi:MAG: hypothetical protein JXA46_16305 [Dehalococcoidales bacterium]|nr:hypothetical protein [Dehalococcoidales bacterium]